MSSSICEDNLEKALGYFDVAISFSGDCDVLANRIASVVRYYGLRCYVFSNERVLQSGFDIFQIMSFVYSRTPLAVVLNSRDYRKTRPTQLEFDLIKSSASVDRVLVVDCGGSELDLSEEKYHVAQPTDLEGLVSLIMADALNRAGCT